MLPLVVSRLAVSTLHPQLPCKCNLATYRFGQLVRDTCNMSLLGFCFCLPEQRESHKEQCDYILHCVSQ